MPIHIVFWRQIYKRGNALAGNDPNRVSSDLDDRISDAKKRYARGELNADKHAESKGWAVAIEFVGAVLISAFIGWSIDEYADLETRPWGMIVMLLLGFAAGVRRAMQTSVQFDADPTNDED